MALLERSRVVARGIDGDGAVDPWPWKAPGRLWQHAIVLAVLLFALLPLMDNGSMISADEGAVLAQADITASTGSWGMTNHVPAVDPTGRWFAIDMSDHVGDRFYPYAKHAAYPAFVGALYAHGGLRMVLAASVAATLAAAVMAALIARELAPNLDIATLWIVGVASPLFFDAWWVIAHSIGAAFAAFAAYAATRWCCDAPRRRRSIGGVACAAVGCVGTVAFRSEGMLFGVALGVTVVALAWRSRDRALAVVGGVCGLSALGAWRLDGWIQSQVVGAGRPPFVPGTESSSWVGDRFAGAYATLIRPQLLAPRPAGTLFLMMAILLTIAAGCMRWRPTETRLIRGSAAVAAVAAILVLFCDVAPVPGLLVAFPLVPIGLVALRRDQLRSTPALLAVGTAGLFSMAVLVTQYRVGGTMEWGGRFFHLALPLIVPVLLVAVASLRHHVDRSTARVSLGALGMVMIALLVFSVGSVLRVHRITAGLTDRVHELSADTESARQPGGAVVVSNAAALGRFAWRDAVHDRFLSVPVSKDLGELDRRLAANDVDDFVFASSHDHQRDLARFEHFAPVEGRTIAYESWKLYVMRRVPSPS